MRLRAGGDASHRIDAWACMSHGPTPVAPWPRRNNAGPGHSRMSAPSVLSRRKPMRRRLASRSARRGEICVSSSDRGICARRAQPAIAAISSLSDPTRACISSYIRCACSEKLLSFDACSETGRTRSAAREATSHADAGRAILIGPPLPRGQRYSDPFSGEHGTFYQTLVKRTCSGREVGDT